MPKGSRNAELNKIRALQMHAAQLVQYRRYRGCWLWTGAIDADGYGKLKRFGKTLRAHRVFYEIAKGPIPEGLVVCHTCDTPLCVNPVHLFAATHVENERDKDRKQRRSPSPSLTHPHLLPRGSRHHKAKLVERKAAVIRASKKPTRVLAEKYGVSMSTIQRIRGNKLWTHV